MKARIDYSKRVPGVFSAMLGLEKQVSKSGLESALIHLVKLRASQINGCAYCINMHVHEALAGGESATRLHLLSVWRETTLFSEREKAALVWTETLTRVADHGVPDATFAAVQPHFTEEELTNLTLAVVAINGWNRLAIGFAMEPELKISKEA